MSNAPLLMIPGPVEVSPAVLAAFSAPPPGHTAAPLIESFGIALERMRQVWQAGPESQPFVLTGGGTVGMDMVTANLTQPGDRVLVVDTGYFSDRIAEMLRRQGAEVVAVEAAVGEAPSPEEVRSVMTAQGPFQALYATHVDTSTGVRVDPEPLTRLAREHGMLAVFDGVCATAGERFAMAEWDADVYLTASQKALGLPPGLALLVASSRALAARAARRTPAPPMYLDWEQWLPVMRAYEERRPSYFSTPATNLILALAVGLGEIVEQGVEARFAAHARVARALRAAWSELGLTLVPARPELASNLLSALRFPAGVDGTLVRRILDHGVAVAGGLHPAIRNEYFRVGHMGFVTGRPELLRQTVLAVAAGLG
ncbi:MAG: alanine-glyoxylate transaminase / serine-glyoxylate transaminase / serine-pyruvate transaminase, partial [Acidobacteriota bacterium]|nr:alanine-glyoxylate transaminase / serine-glyoxylate transaminase / serine-pyruvate transaminase [Acidobacteriota bacterium]